MKCKSYYHNLSIDPSGLISSVLGKELEQFSKTTSEIVIFCVFLGIKCDIHMQEFDNNKVPIKKLWQVIVASSVGTVIEW